MTAEAGDATAYLKRILTARVYDVVEETPLEAAPLLSERLGNRVLLKREDLLPVVLVQDPGRLQQDGRTCRPKQLERGVIAASAGNHAQGVALAARRLGCRAVIVMPDDHPAAQGRRGAGLGRRGRAAGETYNDAHRRAVELMQERGLTFVHPFDDPDVIAGQGTVGMEILRQHTTPIHAVFVAVGGGGLDLGNRART